MCRLRLGEALVVAGVIGWTGSRAHAQELRRYEHRVDSLANVWRGTVTQRIAYEQQQRGNYRSFAPIEAGPLHLLVDTATAAMARRAADSVVAQLAPTYGHALDELRRHTLVLRRQRVNDVGEKDTAYVLIAELQSDSTERFSIVVAPELNLVSVSLRDAALKVLLRATDPHFAKWLFAQLPLDTVPSLEWSRTRVALLSSFAVGRRCYAGSIRDCRLALDITESVDPVVETLDASDRRKLVQDLREENMWGRRGGEDCVRGSDSACIAFLRVNHIRAPISSSHRIDVVRLAMALGGPRSMERLLMTNGSVDDRIAAAAHMPTDAVLRRWVSRARDARKASDDMSLGIAASSLGWVLILGAMALRSSRWR